jgi:hypothetical protein
MTVMFHVRVKIVDGIPYYIKGEMGVGMGAWHRAAQVRDMLGLTKMPQHVSREKWNALGSEYYILEVS